MRQLLYSLVIGVTLLCAVSATPASASSRGISTGLPVYVWPGDPYVQTLLDPLQTPHVPSTIIVNINNGNGDMSIMDTVADALRARTDVNGEHPKVIGYVYTSHAERPLADVEASVSGWLTARGGTVHYDGIFFDETTRDCGSTTGSNDYRDYYRTLREFVWNMVPDMQDLVVNNPGTAVNDCYLAPGHRTADIFMTFEGDAATYAQIASAATGWVGYTGGNVFNATTGYRAGTEYNSYSFWHLVYNTPASSLHSTIDTAYSRYAGTVGVTDDYMTNAWLNPWDAAPHYLTEEMYYTGQLPF